MVVNENTYSQNTQSPMPVPAPVPQMILLPQMQKGLQDKLLDYGVKAVLIVAGAWGAKYLFNKWREKNAEDRVGTSPEAQQATALRLAMNPSGRRLLWWVDGIDKDAVFNTAKNIKDFKTVIEEYRKHYAGDNLTNDLRTKLDPEEMTRFLNAVNYNNLDPKTNIAPSGLDYAVNRILITKGKTNVRKTAKYAGTKHLLTSSNVIMVVDAGTAIGITTGRQHFDELAQPSGVLFIEVKVLKKNAPIKESFSVWVAASQVDSITAAQYKQKAFPALAITQKDYDKATAPLNGMNAMPHYKKEVVTTVSTFVMNEKLKVTGRAEANIILGYPIMELNTGDKILVQFLTIDHTVRWVDKAFTKIILK